MQYTLDYVLAKLVSWIALGPTKLPFKEARIRKLENTTE